MRGADEIAAGLDLFGRRDGLPFMPEMARHAGQRFFVGDPIPAVFENDRWGPTRKPIYLLEGLHCSGAVPGEAGPCDRACPLLWHEDWLVFEPEPEPLAPGAKAGAEAEPEPAGEGGAP